MTGRSVRAPSWGDQATDESDESQTQPGDLLSGRVADLDVDSVAAVRDER